MDRKILENRRYVRMSTVFPVEIAPGSETVHGAAHPFLQGFTRNLSAGGLCVELKSLDHTLDQSLLLKDTFLKLTIHPTFSQDSFLAQGRVTWSHKTSQGELSQYWVGIHYTSIDQAINQKLVVFARQSILIPKFALWLTAIVAVGLMAWLGASYWQLEQNRQQVRQLVRQAQTRSILESGLTELQSQKNQSQVALTTLSQKVGELKVQILELEQASDAKQHHLSQELIQAKARETELLQSIEKLKKHEDRIKQDVFKLEQSQGPNDQYLMDQMAGWLASHQHLGTGLVSSFEGDPSMEHWAFSYDQALSVQVFLAQSDTRRAARLLDFYWSRAQRQGGAFFNAYHSVDGYPIEPIVHTGPNVWLGISAAWYEHIVGDGKYLALVKELGELLLSWQDSEGGFSGGPGLQWYSTEHNLDGYAFLGMLHQLTGDLRYQTAQAKCLSWIQKYAYSLNEKRFNRGKGDSTISTDTFSCGMSAIGPEKLAEIAMNPEDILQYAEKHCEVKVDVVRPDGQTLKVRGFDFAKVKNLGRGGVISTEWTAQMVEAYQRMADYFGKLNQTEKSESYEKKASFYLNELQKLLMTSPSKTGQGKGCLPYASIDAVDTGHGWRTPKGLKTGSVSGTAYAYLAWKRWSPFALKTKGTHAE